MKFVYILEDDPKFQKEICEAIFSIDPKIQIRLFPRLESFVDWMKTMMTTGPAAIAQGGAIPVFVPQASVSNEEHQLVLVVSKVEFLGAEQLELLKKTRKLFVERKICTAEDPTAFVLTAFDNPNFQIKDLENRILSNVIFKPFDRLILIQHLTYAIDGRHPASKYTIANQKTTAVVEMLKDVEMESISDVGFVTKSYREIKPGSVSKYYSPVFHSERHRSLFAICRQCYPHPKDPKAYQCSFSFFAVDQTQISSIRKQTRAKEAKSFGFQWMDSSQSRRPVNIVLLDEEEDEVSGLYGHILKSFDQVRILPYRSFANFLSDLDPNSFFQQRDSNIKPFSGANTVTFRFDLSGHIYLGLDSDKNDLSSLFGVSLSDLTANPNWLMQAIDGSQKENFRKCIHHGQIADEGIFQIHIQDNSFLIKVTQVVKDSKQISLTVAEPTKDEQLSWLLKNSKLKEPVDLIIANHRLFGEGARERWGFVKDSLIKRFQLAPQIVMTSKKDFTDAQERSLGEFVQDIFFKPIDRVYFSQKLKCLLPQLQEKADSIVIRDMSVDEIIKAAGPVTVSELSEAGLVMQYYRPIQLGSFREIVLWQPYEIGAPELLATCNFVEENSAEKGTHNIHLVFFGVSDHFLKHIRVWIRDNYVLSKEGKAS